MQDDPDDINGVNKRNQLDKVVYGYNSQMSKVRYFPHFLTYHPISINREHCKIFQILHHCQVKNKEEEEEEDSSFENDDEDSSFESEDDDDFDFEYEENSDDAKHNF